MDVGEAGWVVPQAMYADDQRRLWLNGNSTIRAEPGGTVRMAVRRDEAGWHVDASGCRPDERWGSRKGIVVNIFPRLKAGDFQGSSPLG